MTELPLIQLPPNALGPLGIAIGDDPDAGGGRPGRDQVFVPLVEVAWMDERQRCGQVVDFLAAGGDADHLPEFRACAGYRAGKCSMDGYRSPCAFHELGGQVWQDARQWRRFGDGLLYVGDRTEAEIAEMIAALDGGL